MKIIIKERKADDYGDGEYFGLNVVDDTNKQRGFSAGHGEPEDNTLGRDLNFVYGIEDMLRMAYESGKRGEEYIVEKSELTEEDEDY